MNFQMNMAANANRAWGSIKFATNDTPPSYVFKNAFVDSVSNSTLSFMLLTGHSTDLLPSRNIVPYHELPIYRTTGGAAIAGRSVAPDATFKKRAPWRCLR